MKRTLLLLVSVLLASIVAAQEETATDVFREQYIQLSSQYAKNPDDVANLMDMAHFYTNADNPQYNLAYAADLLGRAEELYTLWLQDKGRYRDMQRLIKKGITLSLIRQQRQSVTEQAETYVRNSMQRMGQTEIKAFLSSFSDNPTITTRLHSKRIADEYQGVCRENTIEAYYSFLIAHPSIPEADSAEAALERMAPRYFSVYATEEEIDTAAAAFPSSRALQYAAMRQKSRIAYRAACRKNTEEAYSLYLERYPRGDNYLDALNHLQTLRSMDFGLITTVQGYADFAEAHSDDPLADGALAKLRALIFDRHSQEAATVYLERFPLDEHYSDVFKEYYSWFAAEGNRQPIESFAEDYPDYPFQMAVQSDLARSVVFDSFDLTKPFVETDFNRLTDCIHLFTGRKGAFVALQRVLQQQIARREWSAAQQRMNQFAICFEDNGAKEYEELSSLLSAKETVARKQAFARDGVQHVFANPQGTRLYFTEQNKDVKAHKNTLRARRDSIQVVTIEKGGISVGYARRSTKGKGAWEYAGRVHIEGATGNVTAFGFYDGGQRVLVGMDDDIWSAQVVNDTLWTNLERFGEPVNTIYVETDAYMLPDGSGMLIASDRPGGHNVQESGAYYHGDTALATDLYYLPYIDGRWGDPVNLGLPVNSPCCERSPLLSRNMKTLYFITDARGLGYGDVYMSTRSDITDWTNWTNPINMGKGVNGAFPEKSISFMPGEKSVLLTAQPHAGAGSLCYTFATRHDTSDCHRTVQVNLVEAVDVMRGLDVVDISAKRIAAHLTDDELDSVQPLRLYKGKTYALVPDADWMFVPTLIVNSSATALAMEGYMMEELRQRKEPLPLPLVQFYGSTSRLVPLAKRELDNVVRFMRQHAGSRVTISVHTQGDDERQCYNMTLNRAMSIRNYLSEQSIDPSRVHISAYGNMMYKKGLKPSQVEIAFQ